MGEGGMMKGPPTFLLHKFFGAPTAYKLEEKSRENLQEFGENRRCVLVGVKV